MQFLFYYERSLKNQREICENCVREHTAPGKLTRNANEQTTTSVKTLRYLGVEQIESKSHEDFNKKSWYHNIFCDHFLANSEQKFGKCSR